LRLNCQTWGSGVRRSQSKDSPAERLILRHGRECKAAGPAPAPSPSSKQPDPAKCRPNWRFTTGKLNRNGMDLVPEATPNGIQESRTPRKVHGIQPDDQHRPGHRRSWHLSNYNTAPSLISPSYCVLSPSSPALHSMERRAFPYYSCLSRRSRGSFPCQSFWAASHRPSLQVCLGVCIQRPGWAGAGNREKSRRRYA